MATVVDVQHLEKRYGSYVAVEDVTFTVGEGEIFGIAWAGTDEINLVHATPFRR